MAKKILIADDEENIRELVWVSLEDEGFEIHEAVNGDEALSKARELKPDIIILDVMMPGKTGYEVCEELKRDPDTSDIFVLFLSARGSFISEQTGKIKGGNEYMVKPFEPAELRKKVKNALGLKLY